MYFKNRTEAGQKLSETLLNYKDDPTAIIALSDGAIVVATQIAAKLHCSISLLLMEPILLPGEPEAVAVIDQDGGFTYNHMYSAGQIEEFTMEYYKYIEQAKMDKMSEMHRLFGREGLIRKDLLKGHNIILVSDGFSSGYSLDAAIQYLKPVKTKRLIVATPVASPNAVDRMHVLTDEIHCLTVMANFLGTNHYYEENDLPSHETIVNTIQNIMEHWK